MAPLVTLSAPAVAALRTSLVRHLPAVVFSAQMVVGEWGDGSGGAVRNAPGDPGQAAGPPSGGSLWAIFLGGGALLGLLGTILTVTNERSLRGYQRETEEKLKTVQYQIDTQRNQIEAQRTFVDAEIRRKQTDVEVLIKFRELYLDNRSRRLTRYFVRNIEDPRLRSDLRQFVVWDILERLAKSKRGFHFDADSDDWHMLGETVYDLKHDSLRTVYGSPVEHWWNQVQRMTEDSRWKDRKADLSRMFGWLERHYLQTENTSMQNASALLPGQSASDSAR